VHIVVLEIVESAHRTDLVPTCYIVPTDRTTRVVAAQGLVAGASDAEGDFLTVTLVEVPDHGFLVAASDGSFRSRPATGYMNPARKFIR
jgi:hypothetical protein